MLEPAGFVWGHFTTDDGVLLRWGRLSPPEPKLQCVLVGGFCEFTEKYFEVIADLALLGMAVWCLDWRGQGGSQRPSMLPNRPRGRDGSRDIKDLVSFTQAMIDQRRPIVLVGHSMGAVIGFKTLAEHPGLFDSAVLSAPMFSVATQGLPRWLARAIAGGIESVGFGTSLIPGLSILDVDAMTTAETSAISSDPVRCQLMQRWFAVRHDLRLDGTTFGWYRWALDFASTFAEADMFTTVSTPTLFGLAGQDVFVNAARIRAVACHMPRAKLIELPESRHEIFHERDDIRNAWLKAIDEFIKSSLVGHG